MVEQGTIYELVKVDAIRDERGDAYDWSFTVVATGKSVKGLVKYARLKKLDIYTHIIEVNQESVGSVYDNL